MLGGSDIIMNEEDFYNVKEILEEDSEDESRENSKENPIRVLCKKVVVWVVIVFLVFWSVGRFYWWY